jgi:hypothetical protein
MLKDFRLAWTERETRDEKRIDSANAKQKLK